LGVAAAVETGAAGVRDGFVDFDYYWVVELDVLAGDALVLMSCVR